MQAVVAGLSDAELKERMSEVAGRLMETCQGSMYGMMKVRIEACSVESLECVSSYLTEEWMKNPFGAVHGGMVTTMMDSAMGCFASCVAGVGTPTISIDTNYLRPVPLDQRLCIRAKVTGLGRTVAYLSGEAWMEGCPEKLVATACGTYFTGGAKG